MSTTDWEWETPAGLEPGDAAVQAHLLLNAFAVMAGRAATLRVHWERLPAETRTEWLAEMERSATAATALFRDLTLRPAARPADQPS